MRTVVHIGSIHNPAGGMTTVAHQLAGWSLPEVTQVMMPTTRRRGRRDDLLLVLAACVRVLTHPRPLVIHAHLAQDGFWREGAIIRWSRLWGARVVVHLHGSRFETYSQTHPRMVRFALGPAHTVLCLTQATATIVRRRLPEASVVLVHNYVDLPASTSERRDRVVTFVGAAGHRKGLDVLIDSWEALRQLPELSDWHLLVVGPAEDRLTEERLRSLSAVDPTVRWLGQVPHAEVLELWERSRLAVLPSRAEAFPMSLLEAMSAGAVPISTSVGGVPRLVGTAGWVCQPDSVAALTTSLTAAMSLSDDAWRELSLRARSRVEQEWSRSALREVLHAVWTEGQLAGSGSLEG